MAMTLADVRERHIPHRVNLLITFRERFRSTDHSPDALDALANKHGRDFYRCAKDICFVMTRYFMEAMGVHLKCGAHNYKDRPPGAALGKFVSSPLRVGQFENLGLGTKEQKVLLEMLKAANRAVAHLEETDVDHYFDTPLRDQEMIPIIDWIEQLIIDKIYDGNKSMFNMAMALPENDMRRP